MSSDAELHKGLSPELLNWELVTRIKTFFVDLVVKQLNFDVNFSLVLSLFLVTSIHLMVV